MDQRHQAALSTFADHVVARVARGEADFVEGVRRECPEMTDADARRVLAVYRHLRVARVDVHDGAIRVTHGGLWDAAMLRRALAGHDEAMSLRVGRGKRQGGAA